jgi:hypothetical protein
MLKNMTRDQHYQRGPRVLRGTCYCKTECGPLPFQIPQKICREYITFLLSPFHGYTKSCILNSRYSHMLDIVVVMFVFCISLDFRFEFGTFCIIDMLSKQHIKHFSQTAVTEKCDQPVKKFAVFCGSGRLKQYRVHKSPPLDLSWTRRIQFTPHGLFTQHSF